MSANESDERLFAVQASELETDDGCIGCPAVQGGLTPNQIRDDPIRQITDHYDIRFDHERPVPEEEAREAWLAAIEECEGWWGADDSSVQAGLEVARELGWIDEEGGVDNDE